MYRQFKQFLPPRTSSHGAPNVKPRGVRAPVVQAKLGAPYSGGMNHAARRAQSAMGPGSPGPIYRRSPVHLPAQAKMAPSSPPLPDRFAQRLQAAVGNRTPVMPQMNPIPHRPVIQAKMAPTAPVLPDRALQRAHVAQTYHISPVPRKQPPVQAKFPGGLVQLPGRFNVIQKASKKKKGIKRSFSETVHKEGEDVFGEAKPFDPKAGTSLDTSRSTPYFAYKEAHDFLRAVHTFRPKEGEHGVHTGLKAPTASGERPFAQWSPTGSSKYRGDILIDLPKEASHKGLAGTDYPDIPGIFSKIAKDAGMTESEVARAHIKLLKGKIPDVAKDYPHLTLEHHDRIRYNLSIMMGAETDRYHPAFAHAFMTLHNIKHGKLTAAEAFGKKTGDVGKFIAAHPGSKKTMEAYHALKETGTPPAKEGFGSTYTRKGKTFTRPTQVEFEKSIHETQKHFMETAETKSKKPITRKLVKGGGIGPVLEQKIFRHFREGHASPPEYLPPAKATSAKKKGKKQIRKAAPKAKPVAHESIASRVKKRQRTGPKP